MTIRGKDIREGGGIHRSRGQSTKLHSAKINSNVLQHNNVAVVWYNFKVTRNVSKFPQKMSFINLRKFGNAN